MVQEALLMPRLLAARLHETGVFESTHRNDMILATDGSRAARISIRDVNDDADSIVSHVLRFSRQGPHFLVGRLTPRRKQT